MNLLIDGSILPPPTEITCFRDVTLYGSVFCSLDVLIEFESEYDIRKYLLNVYQITMTLIWILLVEYTCGVWSVS